MITKGEGPLGRIYDRLRKRSQRKLYSRDIDDSVAALLGQVAHDHYVAGVRDALQQVEDLCCECQQVETADDLEWPRFSVIGAKGIVHA